MKTRNICNFACQRVNTGPLFASEWGQALAFTKTNLAIPSVKPLADIELSS